MTRLILALITTLIFSNTLAAMIVELSLSELIASSDGIVIAKVESCEILKAEKDEIPLTETIYSVELCHKGNLHKAEKFAIKIAGSPQIKLPESPALLEKGEKALIFLKKSETGEWHINNSAQGLWPIDSKTGETLGMGFNFSVAKVIEEIGKSGR